MSSGPENSEYNGETQDSTCRRVTGAARRPDSMIIDNPVVAVVATLATKGDEAGFFAACLADEGIQTELIDISLDASRPLGGHRKIAAMNAAARRAQEQLTRLAAMGRLAAAAGMGGGTGSQMAAAAMSALPLSLPKLLVTTMASDPRPAATGSGIILIPTVADLAGLNSLTRPALRRAAAVAGGLARADLGKDGGENGSAIGISSLGVTGGFVDAAVSELARQGFEPVCFHANNFGGNALAAMAAAGKLSGVIDCTTHEAVSLLFDPHSAIRRDRFSATGNGPRVVLPGGVNFFTLEAGRSYPVDISGRKRCPHSQQFEHAALNDEELGRAGRFLGNELSKTTAATAVLLPMGGFSSEDRSGGLIDNPGGRCAFAEAIMDVSGKAIEIRQTDRHINDRETVDLAVEMLLRLMPRQPDSEGKAA